MEVAQLFDSCFRYVYDKAYNATQDVRRAEMITKKVFMLLAECCNEKVEREEWFATVEAITSHEINKYMFRAKVKNFGKNKRSLK